MSRPPELKTSAELSRLGSFAPHFHELTIDDAWRAEVQALGRHGRLRTFAQRLARLYLSDFDANALTGMYQMLLLPEHAFRSLLAGRTGGRLLDVGAGSGDVTAKLAPCFDQLEATEVSRGMAKKLTKRGVRCHAVDLTEAPLPDQSFDAVSLLNVLDRCERPRRLLRHCLQALRPGGTFLVALALPYRPFYFDGPTTPEPRERLECDPGPSGAWEDAARRFVERDLLPLDLTLERFSRAPYLSAGDSKSSLYELDDVVAVLTKR
ncbi:MAG: methyltransferase domain-containing protein [Myxococcales bacterium]|nr:MAG: methyltransferase domain-containing protein [Myxococcales bacterium]